VTGEPPCVVFALQREAKPFLRRLRGVRKDASAPWRGWLGRAAEGLAVRVMLCGVGKWSARGMLGKWLETAAPPPLLIAAGFAGALTPELHAGDIVRPAEIVDEDGQVWPVRGLPGAAGRMVTHTHMIGQPVDKQALGQRWGASAVDMESAEIARLCAERGIPFGCVRVISDRMQDALSPKLLVLLEGHSRREVSLRRVLWEVAKSPRFAVELARLARTTGRAARRLADALASELGL
jgi:adenosylhomocysteine nucleosidase